ncbi:MAG: hypothetical protein AAF547_02305 [Actinomycetota bacterium]
MVLELGPWPTDDAVRWSKFARRIVCELRTSPTDDAVAPADVLDLWSRTIDRWSTEAHAALAENRPFRLTSELEPEVVEYLLHGLDRCLHSPTVMRLITPSEAIEQRAFTMLVVRAFVDGLLAECSSCQQYADQVMTSLGTLLTE